MSGSGLEAREAVTQMSAGAAVIWRCGWGRGALPRWPIMWLACRGWIWTGGFCPLQCASVCMAAECLPKVTTDFPQSRWSQRASRNCSIFYELAWGAPHLYYHSAICYSCQLHKGVTTKRRESLWRLTFTSPHMAVLLGFWNFSSCFSPSANQWQYHPSNE